MAKGNTGANISHVIRFFVVKSKNVKNLERLGHEKLRFFIQPAEFYRSSGISIDHLIDDMPGFAKY